MLRSLKRDNGAKLFICIHIPSLEITRRLHLWRSRAPRASLATLGLRVHHLGGLGGIHVQRRLLCVTFFNQEESGAQRRNLGHVRVVHRCNACCGAKTHTRLLHDFLLKRLRARDGPRKELCRISAGLLSRKVHNGACTEMYKLTSVLTSRTSFRM